MSKLMDDFDSPESNAEAMTPVIGSLIQQIAQLTQNNANIQAAANKLQSIVNKAQKRIDELETANVKLNETNQELKGKGKVVDIAATEEASKP